LALFVRLPSARVDKVVTQASENLHNSCPEQMQQILALLDHLIRAGK
jgi:hypothetical protein